MGFDIPGFHIDDDSPEGRALGKIVESEGVTPEEALRRSLRRSEILTPAEEAIGAFSLPEKELSPAERAWGAFSSTVDAALLDEAMDFVRECRRIESESMARRWG